MIDFYSFFINSQQIILALSVYIIVFRGIDFLGKRKRKTGILLMMAVTAASGCFILSHHIDNDKGLVGKCVKFSSPNQYYVLKGEISRKEDKLKEFEKALAHGGDVETIEKAIEKIKQDIEEDKLKQNEVGPKKGKIAGVVKGTHLISLENSSEVLVKPFSRLLKEFSVDEVNCEY